MSFKTKIEKGVPIPPATGQSKGYTAFLRTMKKGESAVLPLKDTAAVGMYAHAAWGKGSYASRKIGKNKVRIWRLK
jgi:hypothetical protein